MGPVESYIRQKITDQGTICAALIDSEGISMKAATDIALGSQECGASLIMVGGSTAVDQIELDSIVRSVKKISSIPILLFPGNITGVSPHADAILFSSLLNSDNPYFITEAQALSAFLVKKYNLEALPMGYIIIGEGGATGFIGRARGIPTTKPKLASMYALASKYLGMRFVYLEAGSGVTSHASLEVIKQVRTVFDDVLIVGGGITQPEEAKNITSAGANIIVIGTLLERKNFRPTLKQIISSIRDSSKGSNIKLQH